MATNNNSLNILWLSVNREHRAFQFYPCLLREMCTHHNITTIIRNPSNYILESQYIHKIYTKKHIPNDTEYINDTINTKNKFDLVITDALGVYLDILSIQHIMLPKLALINDVHLNNITKLKLLALQRDKYTALCYTYKKRTQKAILTNPNYVINKSLWLPLAIDPSIFKNWGFKKEHSILLSGRINSVYPLRQKLLNLSGDYPKLITVLPHYHNLKNNIACTQYKQHQYSQQINRYIAAISTVSNYQYVVSKFFEIPASNTLLISNYIPELSELGFKPNYNMCVLNSTQNLYTQCSTILNNKNINTIIKNGYDLIHKLHTIKHRTKQLTDFLHTIG